MTATSLISRLADLLVPAPAVKRAERGPAISPAAAPAAAPKSVAAKAVIEVRRGIASRWIVRRRGTLIEATFDARRDAIEFARLIGMAAGSYRILFETRGGEVVEERFIPR
ncbi:MAG TPA: hypothetical protein VIF14_14220 [Alphaproteobacteria bacterium]|jgi:hypothetical protein